ncbi:acyltransferase [Hyphomicrobium sp. ghe19]|uniref:acyltransferase family protein n=1 Tax=Hyphomicrobium sp. ghe19 TaxID=2682968 RepID=UPI001367298E|nr:O-acetyltransferase OatA [Hyphomicrobium sp. ghe19]
MQKVRSVDGLRGMAALSVAWFHTYTQNGGVLVSNSMPSTFNTVSVWGRFGVQLFFVISGFVIAYTLYNDRTINSSKAVCTYFIRRSVRLDPTYWTALAAYVFGVPLLLSISSVDIFPVREGSAVEMSKNIFYFLPLDARLYLPVAWTLGVEVQFYVFFALIVLLLNRFEEQGLPRDRVFCAVALVLIAASAVRLANLVSLDEQWLYHHLHTFLGGILAALTLRRIRGALALYWLNAGAMLAAFGFCRDSYVLASLASSLLLMAAVWWRPLSQMLSNRLLSELGALSYCIYLFHMLIGGITIALLQKLVSGESGLHQVGFVIVGIFATIAVSAVVYALIEKPSIVASKYFSVTRADSAAVRAGTLLLMKSSTMDKPPPGQFRGIEGHLPSHAHIVSPGDRN